LNLLHRIILWLNHMVNLLRLFWLVETYSR
jgi:hypothetical protein